MFKERTFRMCGIEEKEKMFNCWIKYESSALMLWHTKDSLTSRLVRHEWQWCILWARTKDVSHTELKSEREREELIDIWWWMLLLSWIHCFSPIQGSAAHRIIRVKKVIKVSRLCCLTELPLSSPQWMCNIPFKLNERKHLERAQVSSFVCAEMLTQEVDGLWQNRKTILLLSMML